MPNDETDYFELGEEYLATARQISDPALRAFYINLAGGYQRLAEFHKRIRPVVEAAAKVEAGED